MTGGRLAAWAQLLRVSAVSTVPGDALVGAVATGRSPGRGTALAAGASLCLYEAGMALNDWADREEDARERPERPLPSGRIRPAAALTAATGLTAAGLALAARAGRLPLATATALAATVWAYDLRLKHTPAGPAVMAAARSLDVLLGAAATTTHGSPSHRTPTPSTSHVPSLRAAAPSASHAPSLTSAVSAGGPAPVFGAAGLMGVHTLAVTAVSRREAEGGAPGVPLAALGAVGTISGLLLRPRTPLAVAAGAMYAGTATRPLAHAALNPSPPLLQRAVGGGIRAMIPLQAALAARASRTAGQDGLGNDSGGAAASVSAVALLGLLPIARRLSRKVSPT